MADIMTRWLNGYRGKLIAVKRITMVLLERDVVESPWSAAFEWLTMKSIRACQDAEKNLTHGRKIATDEHGTKRSDGKIWIPNEATEMHLKLLVIAHCGNAGHRSAESTERILREEY